MWLILLFNLFFWSPFVFFVSFWFHFYASPHFLCVDLRLSSILLLVLPFLPLLTVFVSCLPKDWIWQVRLFSLWEYVYLESASHFTKTCFSSNFLKSLHSLVTLTLPPFKTFLLVLLSNYAKANQIMITITKMFSHCYSPA